MFHSHSHTSQLRQPYLWLFFLLLSSYQRIRILSFFAMCNHFQSNLSPNIIFLWPLFTLRNINLLLLLSQHSLNRVRNVSGQWKQDIRRSILFLGVSKIPQIISPKPHYKTILVIPFLFLRFQDVIKNEFYCFIYAN